MHEVDEAVLTNFVIWKKEWKEGQSHICRRASALPTNITIVWVEPKLIGGKYIFQNFSHLPIVYNAVICVYIILQEGTGPIQFVKNGLKIDGTTYVMDTLHTNKVGYSYTQLSHVSTSKQKSYHYFFSCVCLYTITRWHVSHLQTYWNQSRNFSFTYSNRH